MQSFEFRPASVGNVIPAAVVPSVPEDLVFRLQYRLADFGEYQFDQWWIDIRSIYRIGGSKAINFDPLIEYWWRSCLFNNTDIDPAVCESYLLAKLFENTRRNGSKRVLVDSVPRRSNRQKQAEIVENLEQMLVSSHGNETTIVEFSRKTADHIGPPKFEPEVTELYEEFAMELLDPAVLKLQQGRENEGTELAMGVWDKMDRRFGRRCNAPRQKQVMDVLSYEARATIHRCYSHLWELVSQWLVSERSHENASLVFHRFWHLDLFWPSNESSDQNFHLFHGHILGLHPGTHSFIQTKTGKELIGDWLSVAPVDWQFSDKPETPELRRLLHGLLIAVIEYSERHDLANFLRRGNAG